MESQTGIAQGTGARHARIARWLLLVLTICVLAFLIWRALEPRSRKTPTLRPTDQILASYEGQPVTAVEIAGRPDLKVAQFSVGVSRNRPGQPFDKQKVDRTAAALKTAGHFESVRVQVEPEAKGLRVLFVIEPAVYYGIFRVSGC